MKKTLQQIEAEVRSVAHGAELWESLKSMRETSIRREQNKNGPLFSREPNHDATVSQ